MDRVLLVEDDKRVASHVCQMAEAEGLYVQHVSSLVELDHWLSTKRPVDAIVLDRILGGVDTKTRVQQIKQKWPAIPILILSAINTPMERAELIDLGVDDYMGKPFLSQEFLARLRALMRRFKSGQMDYREIGDLVLDLPRRILIKGSHQENLPSKEFLLLKLLSNDPGQIFNKTELLDLIWSGGINVETNVVEATVSNLRKRLLQAGSTTLVKNSRNLGYWIES